jgi:integrase
MASIRARGKQKRLYVQFRYSYRQMQEPTQYICERNGEKDCKCRGCKSAQAFALEIDRKIDEKSFNLIDYFPKSKSLRHFGLINVDENIPFNQYARQWLDLKKSVISFSTHKNYKSNVNVLVLELDCLMKNIRPAHIRNIVKSLSDRNIAPKTIKNIIHMLHNIFAQACEDKIITENPCDNTRLPKIVRTPPDPFSRDEVNKILEALEKSRPELQAFFAIGFYTGMRTGEILALTWGDIDFNNHKIRVSKTCTNGQLKQGTKTGKIFDVDIIEILDSYLHKHKQHTFLKGDALFLTHRNESVRSYNTITACWYPVLKKLGIREREPYQMRHTFACQMLSAGEDPNWIKNMLGHSNLEMLFKVYGNWYKPPENTRAGSKFQSFVAK